MNLRQKAKRYKALAELYSKQPIMPKINYVKENTTILCSSMRMRKTEYIENINNLDFQKHIERVLSNGLADEIIKYADIKCTEYMPYDEMVIDARIKVVNSVK